jgi:hypothetical protein
MEQKMDKQKVVDFLKLEIMRRGKFIEMIKDTKYGLMFTKMELHPHHDHVDMLSFNVGVNNAYMELLIAVEKGKFDEEEEHDA